MTISIKTFNSKDFNNTVVCHGDDYSAGMTRLRSPGIDSIRISISSGLVINLHKSTDDPEALIHDQDYCDSSYFYQPINGFTTHINDIPSIVLAILSML